MEAGTAHAALPVPIMESFDAALRGLPTSARVHRLGDPDRGVAVTGRARSRRAPAIAAPAA